MTNEELQATETESIASAQIIGDEIESVTAFSEEAADASEDEIAEEEEIEVEIEAEGEEEEEN